MTVQTFFLIGIMTLFNFINPTVNTTDNYSVLYTYENFEIRKYNSLILAEYDDDDNQEFSVLADFIFGGNKEKQQIPMTAPVITTMKANPTMSFVMPFGITNDNCPNPNNSKIIITDVSPRLAATISFSGYPNSEVCESMKKELIETLTSLHIDHKNDFELHVFDPPYKTFNRRNEIVVSINI
ncbi:MAG: hypothetical protein CL847_05235 [Crocinitomicaceae bacterium]|nr:hypothetical protein [Crocinitomicaceae bacterium]|tara:strand:- start:9754 stop:10302 length:549 start_codon:yes stop_codon:yes gene_type:complete